jgi:cytochrome c oxidase subunit 3
VNPPPPVTPPDANTPSPGTHVSAGPIVMLLFLASLGMGFAALIAGFFVLRHQAEVWPPPDTPPLPAWLWLSTALIVASSGSMHWAVVGARGGRPRRLQLGMVLTLALAVAFLVSQVVNWGLALAARMPPDLNMFAVLFYLFTGLHGVHILAGLVPLTVVTIGAFRGRYAPDDHAGVRYCAMFWHFVDIVWVVMFAVLLLGG